MLSVGGILVPRLCCHLSTAAIPKLLACPQKLPAAQCRPALFPATARLRTVAAAASAARRQASALAMATQLAPRAREVLDFW